MCTFFIIIIGVCYVKYTNSDFYVIENKYLKNFQTLLDF